MKTHLYLIGIGGAGMVWIADYALAKGWTLSGTDLVDSESLADFRSRGAEIHIGADSNAIPAGVTEVVISSAVTETSPHYGELLELKRRKVKIYKRAQWLGKLTRSHYTIGVSGTHGKTTTSAMVGWILDCADLDPTVFTGSRVTKWNNRTRIGNSKYLVIEADEFDRSFHNFSVRVAAITNIEADHLDYYTGGLPEIIKSFRRFLRNLPTGVHHAGKERGLVVAYGKSKNIRIALKGFKLSIRYYDENSLWPGLKLPQPGLVYKLNATAAAKICHELGVSNKVISHALATFPGTARRLEKLANYKGVERIDDYAHHPTEIRATLQALREAYPQGKKRITLVFQPHQKNRTSELLADFGRSFDDFPPDTLILAPIYHVAGRDEGIEVTSADIARKIAEKPIPTMEVITPETDADLVSLLRRKPDCDVLVSMGAGSIRRIFDEVCHE